MASEKFLNPQSMAHSLKTSWFQLPELQLDSKVLIQETNYSNTYAPKIKENVYTV